MRVLLVEDNDGDADLVADALSGAVSADIQLARVERISAATEALSKDHFDVVLLDLSLPDSAGLDGLHRLRAAAPSSPIVVLTGSSDTTAGTSALQHGAQDFLQKGQVAGSELLRAIRYARERAQYADRVRLLADVGVAITSSLEAATVMEALRETLRRQFTDVCDVEGAAEGDVPATDRLSSTALAPTTGRLFSVAGEREAGALVEDGDGARIDQLRARGMTSGLVIPFRVQGWPGGALVLGRRADSAAFGPADLSLAEEIMRRVVAALEYSALLEVAERERARAEVASRARDEFLATLSHELRTPLNAILGWTQLLRAGQVSEENRPTALETIERNARSQVALIDDVLDVSRIITGKLRLNVTAVDLAQVLVAALDSIRPAATAKGVHLASESDADVGTVQGDSDRLLQVLWNLLSNAVKFTPRGGRVTVRLRREDSSISIAVCDTGHGIAAELLPHVFERFRQADSTITRSHGGLGLGLAIARHLSEVQGGTIVAESEGAGKGATFVVRLPASLPAEVPASAREVRASILPVPSAQPFRDASLSGLSIVVVDDDADTRVLLAALLERSGATVCTAESVAEGLDSLRQKRPDVLVSDIGMPGASGYDLIQAVRALAFADGGATPAVALTAYARAEDRAHALSVGFDQHVSKPIAPAELVAVITSLMRRTRAAAS